MREWKFFVTRRFVVISTLFFFALLVNALFLVIPPVRFPVNSIVRIEKGQSVSQIGETLKKRNVIKSPLLFKVFIRFAGKTNGVIAGDYYFKEKRSLFSIVSSVSSGNFGLSQVKVTIPEGSTVREIGNIFSRVLPLFQEEAFFKITTNKEGYLFPDTYFFMPTVSNEEIVKQMEDNFHKKFASLHHTEDDKSISDIIIMASIIEEEAITTESRKKVAGILWKRLASGMPLQVDAPFAYTIGKGSFELTEDDLSDDSPYNTYLFTGLPPTPISNPGLDSIAAAIYYEETPFWFYLHDRKENIHYAASFEEHKENKRKYIE